MATIPPAKAKVAPRDLCLTSAKGKEDITALEFPTKHNIRNVPVDDRRSCKLVFNKYLRRCIVDRRDLLCTTAHKGSGKSVLLHFNCYWFVEATGGVAVEITYDDDQMHLYMGGKIKSYMDFNRSLAVRILHRLVSNFANMSIANNAFGPDGTCLKDVLSFHDPLQCSLRVLRRCLAMPPESKILLCVDELAMATRDTVNKLETDELLGFLVSHTDEDETLFLSVSAIGAMDIVRVSTSRRILLQELDPLCFTKDLDQMRIPMLPAALQPFYTSAIREHMPHGLSDVALYSELAGLLSNAAGHARRVEVLFTALRAFEISKQKPTAAWGKKFVRELTKWLHEEVGEGKTRKQQIDADMCAAVSFPSNFDLLLPKKERRQENAQVPTINAEIATALESLAMDAARAFDMPRTARAAEFHEPTLRSTSSGFCQLVTNEHNFVYAYIPMAVLNAQPSTPLGLWPRGEALFFLRDTLNELHKRKMDSDLDFEKALESVLVAALLLFVRGNRGFSPRRLCAPQCGEGLDIWLDSGDVDLWEYDGRNGALNTGTITAADLQILVERLQRSKARGALIHLPYEYDVPSEFYALFKARSGGYALLRIRVKDFSRGHFKSEDIVQAWRTYRSLYPRSVKLQDGTNVAILSLYFCTSELKRSVPADHNEGIITINAMRNWLPTAAHALQHAVHLRELFAWQDVC